MLSSGSKIIKENGIYIVTALVALIFANWGVKEIIFEGQNCCLDYGSLQHDFYFKPVLSIFISKVINLLLGNIGLVFIGQVLLPAAIFYMLVLIFKRYLSKIWSVTIAFVSVFSFKDFAFREFLISIFSSDKIEFSSMLPEIANFPIPALSVIFFLLLFYHSTKLVKLDNKRISIFTVLWALQIYVNAIDSLFGICFWFSYFVIKIFKRTEKDNIKKLAKLVLLQILIAFVIWLPAFTMVDFSVGEMVVTREFNILTYYLLYMLLPVSLVGALFVIHKIDIYEVFYKFWPVYILMVIEFMLVTFAFFFGKGVNLEILTGRIALFFLHFYYYLPVIFYASKEYFEFNVGKDGGKFKNQLRKMIFVIFNKLNYIYLPLIILLVIIFALMSGNNFIR